MGQLDTQFLPNLADEQEKSYDRSQFSKEIPSWCGNLHCALLRPDFNSLILTNCICQFIIIDSTQEGLVRGKIRKNTSFLLARKGTSNW